MTQPIAIRNLKTIAIVGVIFLAGIVPMAMFGLSILFGLLFQIISISFN